MHKCKIKYCSAINIWCLTIDNFMYIEIVQLFYKNTKFYQNRKN